MGREKQLDVAIDCEWHDKLNRFICTVTVHNAGEIISERSWSGDDSTPLIYMATTHYIAQNALFRGDTSLSSRTVNKGDDQLPLPF